ncbi:hypothetical protein Tco_0981633 [Tanacetum coccineum]
MNPTNIKAQAQKIAEYEAKRTKILDEYNHRITHRTDQLPITKISYRVNASSEATIRITKEKGWSSESRSQESSSIMGTLIWTPEAKEFFKKMELTIEEIRLSIEEPLSIRLSGIDGLAECIVSASNLRRIQVIDIVKEVEDQLKTYSSAEMDISWYVEGIRCGSKESQR